MSTRNRFEKLAQLVAIAKSPMMGDIINNLAKEVEEQFKDAINGDEIMVSWHVDDIHSRNDENDDCAGYQELTDDQARDILLNIERRHDADVGINWTVLDIFIDEKMNGRW